MKNGKIGVTTENIFPVIKKFLYSDHEIFLRELISNSVDATQKLKALASMGDVKGDLGDLTIRVSADKDAKTLTVTDRGIGMTADEVERYINQIAFSSAEEFMEKYKNQAIIGHFGLGFYSAFMVADKVEIFTRSYKEGFAPAPVTTRPLKATSRPRIMGSSRLSSCRVRVSFFWVTSVTPTALACTRTSDTFTRSLTEGGGSP